MANRQIENYKEIFMKFGIAKEIITPPMKTRVACDGGGAFGSDYETVHDDVYVRMAVIDDGANKTLLAAFDLLFHSPDLNDALAEYAKEKYGFRPELVIVGCTHAHTAPAVRGYNPGAENPAYERFIIGRAESCLDKAMNSMFEGALTYGAFDAEFNISRRKVVDGKCVFGPAPGHERDTELAVLAVRDLGGAVRGIVMSYACHPVFYPARRELSAEFPGRVTELLDAKYYGSTALYFQSAGGDVRPADTVNGDGFRNPTDYKAVDGFANRLAGGVSALIDGGSMRPLALEINGRAGTAMLPVEPKELEYFISEAKQLKALDARNPNRRNAAEIIKNYAGKPLEVPLRTALIRLGGNVYIAAMGGEPTCGVKKVVREALPGCRVFFIGYTDACAYIVSDAELNEGGYEAECHLEYGHLGPFKPGVDKLYRNKYKELAALINNE